MNKTFGKTLRELRRESQVTQRELASRVGVDFSYISKVENDRLPPPSADTVVAIAKALSVPEGELLALIGKIPSDVERTIATNPEAQEFLRELQLMKLSEKEWKSIRETLSRLREAV
jgi:transcriptional regulator with XRE-family HTH domain